MNVKAAASLGIFALFVLTAYVFVCKADASLNTLQIIVAAGDSIQDAINRAQEGAIIMIQKGVYIERSYPIIVNKTVALVGDGVQSTIIDGDDTDRGIFIVKSDGVKIQNFTIRNTADDPFMPIAGVQLANVRNVEVMDSKIEDCTVGLLLKNSSNTFIGRNIITNNSWAGVFLRDYSLSNLIVGNGILGNKFGVWVADLSCRDNRFYHNNFVDNMNQTMLMGIGGVWDNDYPSGGNYWSDYKGVDRKCGINQDQNGSDGIGDKSYRGLDRYPFMGPICFFDAGRWNSEDYYVVVSSNSTVSDFSFNPIAGSFVKFNVAVPAGKSGFCRVIIPKSLLWVEVDRQWTVKVNGGTAATLLIDESEPKNTHFYLAYGQDARTVEIYGTNAIPEFHIAISIIVMALFTCILMKIGGIRRKKA